MDSEAGRLNMDDFAGWSKLLREDGEGVPSFVIDAAALNANISRMRDIAAGDRLRLVVKSLPCAGLVDYLMAAMHTRKLMVFHLPFIVEAARRWPDADLMLGKPLPAAAVDAFYRRVDSLGRFDARRCLHWLVDTPERVNQYAAVARRHDVVMSVVIEVDVGMHRGGVGSATEVSDLLDAIDHCSGRLQVAGFMGYDAHAGRGVPWVSRPRAVNHSNAIYNRLLEAAYCSHPHLLPEAVLVNGSGSPTCVFHASDSPLNELAIGSLLLKPAEFDLPQLADFEPAGWIATPVIKRQAGIHLPFLEWLGRWSRRDTVFVYGGRWPARPQWPEGMRSSSLYGPSFNQQFFSVPRQAPVAVDDYVFFRPLQSEQVMLSLGEVLVIEKGRVGQRWPVLDVRHGMEDPSAPDRVAS